MIMIYLDLIVNLALLVALSVVSGFIDKRWPRHTRLGVLLQGVLFGSAAVIVMLRPLVLGPGLIFDGRSIMVSLSALFFGPWAAMIAGAMTITGRILLGGMGTLTGILIILSAAGIGLFVHFRLNKTAQPPSIMNLYLFGLAVHFVMLALMFTLPNNAGISVIKRIGLPVMLLYPLATVLVGQILSDHFAAIQHVEALRKSEESLHNIIENIPIMIFMKDAVNLRFVKLNKAGEELLGYSREELLGKSDYDFFTRQQADLFTAKDREVLQGGILVEIPEETIQTSYLGERILHTKKIAITDKQGKPEYLLGIAEDITERKRAEETLRNAHMRLQHFVDANIIGVVVGSPSGAVIEANDYYLHTIGYTREEFEQGSVDWRAITPPECRPADEQAIKELRASGICTPYEKEYVRRDGTRVSVFVSNAVLPGPEEQIAAFVLDITDRKQAEQEIHSLNVELEKKVDKRTRELEDSQLALLNLVDDLNAGAKKVVQANEALAATNKELEAFSYSVSHDLRAPLRGMDGFSLALLEDYGDKLDDTGKNYLERIRTGTQRMGLLIDDMLKLSRMSRAEFNRRSVDLSETVQQIIETLRQNNPDRAVKTTVQQGIIVQGDQYLLQIALANLLENAWKFTGKTKNARIEFGTEIKDGKPVMFIRDNGVGFDMAYVDKLFGAFQRLHTTAEFPGTGIGLATVQRVIHRHGGQIWAESEIGKGTVFYFTLP